MMVTLRTFSVKCRRDPEVTSPADLWMTQLDSGDFAYPADSLRNDTPY